MRDVQPDYGQVVIAHEDIPGLMPAMTMNFDVAPELLETLEKGQVIEFDLVHDERSYRVTSVRVLEGQAEAGGGPTFAALAASRDAAPGFTLVDQDGEELSLEDLRGRAVVLDFVFANCPGPCPILTGIHVELQRRLPPELRERTWFVSITLDPARDSPEALRAYARQRGADLTDWSFLTGPPETVSGVIERYGVGAIREPNGNIDHLVVTFLIDPEGRIAERYVGLDHGPDEMLRDLARLL